MSNTFYLQGSGKWNDAHFVVNGDKVRVVALLGVVYYLDRDMSKEDARKQWKEMLANGWKMVSQSRVKLHVLKFRIHD